MYHRLLEEVLGANGWHFWTATLPLNFDENFTLDVIIFAQLILLRFFLLLELHFLFLCIRKYSVGFVRLSDVLLGDFAVLESNLAEGYFLNQCGGAG